MGLFSKKEYVCEKCGKTYQRRVNMKGALCDACWRENLEKQRALEKELPGYVKYASTMLGTVYSIEELEKILEHRNAIVEKYRIEGAFHRSDLAGIGANYKNLTEEEGDAIAQVICNCTLVSQPGAVIGGNMLAPTTFDGTVIDVEDVFAVGYTTDKKHQVNNMELISCVVFSNDPYMPVFPMIFAGRKKFYEHTKSAKGREVVGKAFELLCPNLKYPVTDLKALKKQVQKDVNVRGNMDWDFMLDSIGEARSGKGIFNSEKIELDAQSGTIALLDTAGYFVSEDVEKLLRMDKMFNRRFWSKRFDRYWEMENKQQIEWITSPQ